MQSGITRIIIPVWFYIQNAAGSALSPHLSLTLLFLYSCSLVSFAGNMLNKDLASGGSYSHRLAPHAKHLTMVDVIYRALYGFCWPLLPRCPLQCIRPVTQPSLLRHDLSLPRSEGNTKTQCWDMKLDDKLV